MTTANRRAISLDANQPTWAWDALASRLDACTAAWAGGAAPTLAQFLPSEPPSLRRLVLTEVIKLDQEQRLSHGLPLRRAEDYAIEFPELAEGGIPCDLLYEEFHLRRRSGEPVDLQEYQDRFPDRADELGRLLGAVSTYATTTLRAPQPMVHLNPGDQVDDFDLLTLLGEGAFAKVFLARQRSLQRLVALKVSAARGNEPQTLAQLDHPHIVRVYDQKVIMPGGGMRLLYMPYLAGGTLQSVLEHARAVPPEKRTGRTLIEAIDRVLQRRGEEPPTEAPLRSQLSQLTWPQAVAWLGARLADALHYAHRRGVLHRDIKPANVLLTADGAPRLADFNVGHCSKLEGVSPRAFFGGSLVYMSPEQLEAFNPAHDRDPGSLDGRSDQYSLGVTLWELLTGERPFGPESVGGPLPIAIAELTARRKAGVPAEAARAVPPGTPTHLEQAIRRCLAAEPGDRFGDAAALGRALELSLHARAAALLDPPPKSWRHLIRRWPLTCLLVTGFIPNVAAGVFNYLYNKKEVIEPSGLKSLETAFESIQLAINLACFPLGVLVFILVSRPVLQALAAVRAGIELAPAALAEARQKSLRLGWYGVWISVGFWLSAGIVYPVCLTAVVPDLRSGIRGQLYFHFLASLILCGLIAGSYPFFFGTALATGAFYPMLLRPGVEASGDRNALRRLDRAVWPMLLLAAAVPLGGVVLLVGIRALNPVVVGFLCVVGLVGLGVAVILARRVQQDLIALRPLLGPSSAPVGMDESLSARSWGG